MKIVVEFASLEEFETFRGKVEIPMKTEGKEAVKEKKSDMKEELPKKEESAAVKEAVEEKTYTKEDVRAVLMKVKRAKGDNVLSGLLESFGASKLTEVKTSDYSEMIQKAEELLNAQ